MTEGQHNTHPNCKCPHCNRDADGNLAKVKYTKLHVIEIVCIYGFLFGAKILGVDEPVLLDYNEVHGGKAIGSNQTILVRTEYLEVFDQFNKKEVNREECCEYKQIEED